MPENTKAMKLYILHDSDEWMKAWRPSLDSQFGPDGYEEWLLDGQDQNPKNFNLNFDFGQPPPEGVFFCKGSGSSHMRGLPHARDSFAAVLQWLEYHGRTVVNGERAFAAETSKVSQLVAMSNFGLKFAKTTAVFGTCNLVQGSEAFLATLEKGQGFWIRYNRAGCGRGLCLCYSVADVEAFLATGQRSPDEIYILQQWLNIPAVVRLEFSFGNLLYGLEVRNVHSSAVMAPCGCVPQFDMKNAKDHACTAFGQSSEPVQISREVAIRSTSSSAVLGLIAGALLSWLSRRGTGARMLWKKLLATGLLGGALTAIIRAVLTASKSSYSSKPAIKAPPAQQNPVSLLTPKELVKKYPVLATVPEKVKHLMSDMNAGTMALDVAMVDHQVMVLDINIHTNYNTQRESQHNLPLENTGIGSVCLGLSSLMRSIGQSADLDLHQMPSDNLVFGIGLPRTGSHSLAEALKVMGFRGRHNDVLAKRHTQYTPNTRQFAGYFHVDTSHYRRYQELFTTHPNARFILTTRLDEEWKERLTARTGGHAVDDLPSPNEYLSDVLRFFVNHHATHRLMVCNLSSESDDLLWSKLNGFLPLAKKVERGEHPFPHVSADSQGRITKALKLSKIPSHNELISEFTAEYSVSSPRKAKTNVWSPRKEQTSVSPTTKSPENSDAELASQPDSTTTSASEILNARRVLSGYVDHKNSYSAKFVIRPDNAEGQRVTVLSNDRLTPTTYDRNIFHLSLRVEGTLLETYDAGDCIGIWPENPQDKVNSFITGMGFDGADVLELDSHFPGAEDGVYVLSLQQICTAYLDLLGSPSRSFYLALSKFAKDYVEKETLAELSLARKTADFEAREALAVTHASTLLEFKSLALTPMNLLDLVPFTKPRLYSIASSRHAHPGEVHLCVVEETWKNSQKQEIPGLCSGFLARRGAPGSHSGAGSLVVASLVRSPVLKLPKQSAKPVIMAGMGTGLAPFRAFIEERSVVRAQGEEIGNMRLYFGARHKKDEFLYQNELEGYESEGWLKLRCAWSRDQKHKIYVQNLIEEDEKEIWEALNPEVGGSFYICGPIAPVPDIKKAITKVFNDHGLDGASYLEEMEATGRFAMEVY